MTPNDRFKANQKLVHYCFHKYISTKCPSNIAEDVIQEGFLGLWQACTRFDETKGFQFATFAVPYIIGCMKRFIREQGSTIRIIRSDWNSGDIEKYAVVSLNEILSSEHDLTLEDMLPGKPDECSWIAEDLIDSFLAHERQQWKAKNKSDAKIERDLAILEEWLYGILFFEYPGQEFLADKYQVKQPTVCKVIKQGKKNLQEFLSSIDT